MRFRKSIKIGKGVKLNLSKSGISATAGIKGMSVNIGKNGAYLNTGIPGTGLYNRAKIGGSMDTGGEKNETADTEFKPPYKTFNGFISFFCFIIGLPFTFMGLAAIALYFTSDTNVSLALFIPMTIIGILLFSLHCINHHKANKNYYAKETYKKEMADAYKKTQQQLLKTQEKLLETKVNAINGHELFDGCKIFVINHNNIIAFSEKGFIALFTEKEADTMKLIGIDHITKINQEIKSGDCYARIYTDDFENNVYELFIGATHGNNETENIRKVYNDIKNLYTALKKSGSTGKSIPPE
jgi:hypothetical protein